MEALLIGQLPSPQTSVCFGRNTDQGAEGIKNITKRNAKRTTKKSGLITFEKSSCMKMGDRLTGAKEAMPAERSGRVLEPLLCGIGNVRAP